MQKLYAYVDETGQDTAGAFFLVSVVVTGQEREQLQTILEQIESRSGKGKVKWMSAKDGARTAYIKAVLETPLLAGKLCFAAYHNTKEYFAKTALTTARSISLHVTQEDYKVTVIVDGLPLPQVQRFGTLLRQLDVKTRKVRGVRDETEPLIRLSDALSGFVRSAYAGRADFRVWVERAKASGFIREL
ncbi:MAG: hypothetical protein R3E39_32245 [Anaerolineae bacterium]